MAVARRFREVVYLTANTGEGPARPIRAGERVIGSGAVLLNDAMLDLPIMPEDAP